MRILRYAIIFALVGLSVGYLIYGRVNNEFINPISLFKKPDNILDRLMGGIHGFEKKRQSILLCGVVGCMAGLFFAAMTMKRE